MGRIQLILLLRFIWASYHRLKRNAMTVVVLAYGANVEAGFLAISLAPITGSNCKKFAFAWVYLLHISVLFTWFDSNSQSWESALMRRTQ